MKQLKVVSQTTDQELKKKVEALKKEAQSFFPAFNIFMSTMTKICPIINGLNCLGAPSGTGKTTIANQLVFNLALDIYEKGTDDYILILSNEQDRSQMKLFFCGWYTNKDPRRCNDRHENTLTDSEWIEMAQAADIFDLLPIFLVQDCDKYQNYFRYDTIDAQLTKTYRKKNRAPKLLVIDYIQNIRLTDPDMDERLTYNAYANQLFHHLNQNPFGKYPILALAQLDQEKFFHKEPYANDNWIKYSKGLYQVFDTVSYYYLYQGIYKWKAIKIRFIGELGSHIEVGLDKGRLYEKEVSEQELNGDEENV